MGAAKGTQQNLNRTPTYHFVLMLGLPVIGSVLCSFVSFVGNQYIVEEVAFVHGPDLYCHSSNVTQVGEGLLVLKVVRVCNLAWLPDSLQEMRCVQVQELPLYE